MISAELQAHPQTHNALVSGIAVHIVRPQPGTLALTFALSGDLARLRIPPPSSAQSCYMAERLWQHTCFEAFIGVPGSQAYYEFNFAPSGQWMAYAFRDYRDGAALTDETLAPRITLRTSDKKLELDAVITLDKLALLPPPRSPLRLGLSAVVEDDSGAISWWALRHAPGKPDFHHADAFALQL